MRKTNKLLAVLLAALVSLTAMTVPAAAEQETALGVVNGNLNEVNASNRPKDMTVEKSGQTSVVWSSDTYRRGDSGYAVLMQCVDSADSTTISATMTGLEEGKLYTASLWFYVAEAPESGNGTIKLWTFAENKYADGNIVSGNPTLDSLEISGTYKDGKWHKLMHTFTCNAPATPKLRIDVLGAGYTVYIDDITAKEETNVLQSNGRPTGQTVTTKDTDFELGQLRGFSIGTSKQTIEETETTVNNVDVSLTTDATSGNHGVQMIKKYESNNGLYATILHDVFEKGATYKFSYSIKRAATDVAATAAFRLITGSGDIWNSAVAGNTWERQSFYLTIPDAYFNTTTNVVLYINLHGYYANCAVNAGVILDDLRLEKVANETSFVNSAGFSVTEAAAGTALTASVTRVPAVSGTAESALYVVATYKTEEDGSVTVTDVKCEAVSITASDSYVTKAIPVTMPTPEDTETYSIKSFVWDGTLSPMGSVCTAELAAE